MAQFFPIVFLKQKIINSIKCNSGMKEKEGRKLIEAGSECNWLIGHPRRAEICCLLLLWIPFPTQFARLPTSARALTIFLTPQIEHYATPHQRFRTHSRESNEAPHIAHKVLPLSCNRTSPSQRAVKFYCLPIIPQSYCVQCQKIASPPTGLNSTRPLTLTSTQIERNWAKYSIITLNVKSHPTFTLSSPCPQLHGHWEKLSVREKSVGK